VSYVTTYTIEDFRASWKTVLAYYDGNEAGRVQDTVINEQLERMVDILGREEAEVGPMGPCVEDMLQRRILDVLVQLGQGEQPEGMLEVVIRNMTSLLQRLKQPLLHQVGVHRPVKALVKAGANSRLMSSHPSLEVAFVEFLATLCKLLVATPSLVEFFMEAAETQSTSSTPVNSPSKPGAKRGAEPFVASHFALFSSLVKMIQSDDPTVAMLARGALVDCLSLPSESVAKFAEGVGQVSQILIRDAVVLFDYLPKTLSSAHVHSIHLLELPYNVFDRAPLAMLSPSLNSNAAIASPLSSPVSSRNKASATPPASQQQQSPQAGVLDIVLAFIIQLRFLNEVARSPIHPAVRASLELALYQQFLVPLVQPALQQASEPGAISHTAIVAKTLEYMSRPGLAAVFGRFLVGLPPGDLSALSDPLPSGRALSDAAARPVTLKEDSALRDKLISRCDAISEDLSIVTLRLFDVLLSRNVGEVVDALVGRYLRQKSYLLPKNTFPDAVQPPSSDAPTALPVDPAMTVDDDDDDLADLRVVSVPGVDFDDARVAGTVTFFMSLLPSGAQSTTAEEGSDYVAYFADSQAALVRSLVASAYDINMPLLALPMPKSLHGSVGNLTEQAPGTPDSADGSLSLGVEQAEGAFMFMMLNKLERLFDQSYAVNLMLTSVFSKLAIAPFEHVRAFLLDPSLSVDAEARTLPHVLSKVAQEAVGRSKRIDNYAALVRDCRKRLDTGDSDARTESNLAEFIGTNRRLLEGVIVLEEFCKELAAVAVVTAGM
ncbi:hypothetical protein CAOG_09142, partial [Capsaspora owczarzaki ATCC 30864]